jgi:major vault protein
MSKIYNIKPYQYAHILDKNTNNRYLLEGPVNYAIQENEILVDEKIHNMITISNLFQVLVMNPVEKDSTGKCLKDKFNNPKTRWGVVETRTRDQWKKPFPLYPNEKVVANKEMRFIPKEEALHLRAVLNSIDDEGTQRKIGEEWLHVGPAYYVERYEFELIKEVKSHIITYPNALQVAALRNFTDNTGAERIAGEEWLIREEGSYLPHVYEHVVKSINANILNVNTAVQLKALNNYTDIYGKQRKAGDQWIVTRETASFHICGIYEELVKVLKRFVLNINQYVIIVNPWNDTTNKNDLGEQKLIKGEADFFLRPGEILGVNKKVNILTKSNALLLQAIENHKDEMGVERISGEKWMIQGPCRYVPSEQVKIMQNRNIITLDKNEGIYIRDKMNGNVRIHQGSSYLLQPNEILWEKELPSHIEKIFLQDQCKTSRDKTRIVTYKCPNNSVMQIYSLKEKTNRICLGPNLVVLAPDEEFCLMNLSGGTPKLEGLVRTLYLRLGPNFSTDEFLVETSDHTRLTLRISYNWLFDINNSEIEAKKIFSVRDFIGDLCLTMASKIRSHIATITFEDFHKNSDLFIKKSVFGEKEGKIMSSTRFDVCNLLINDVDVKSVIPDDPTTRELLAKSVSLAIELATKTIEQGFNIEAQIKDQEFKGELEKLKIANDIQLVEKNIIFNKYKVESQIIESTGLSRAQAQAQKDAALIESNAEVEYSKKLTESSEIENSFELSKIIKENDNTYLKKSENQRLELKEKTANNEIESNKFQKIMEALGPQTLIEISRAGPELQAKLLKGLNMSGYIVTDGNNPVNLFNIANGVTDNSGR